jgi:hypothetical protein
MFRILRCFVVTLVFFFVVLERSVHDSRQNSCMTLKLLDDPTFYKVYDFSSKQSYTLKCGESDPDVRTLIAQNIKFWS